MRPEYRKRRVQGPCHKGTPLLLQGFNITHPVRFGDTSFQFSICAGGYNKSCHSEKEVLVAWPIQHDSGHQFWCSFGVVAFCRRKSLRLGLNPGPHGPKITKPVWHPPYYKLNLRKKFILLHHKNERPFEEVPGSSPGSGKILFIFTLSPLCTKIQKCKNLNDLPKLVAWNITQWS